MSGALYLGGVMTVNHLFYWLCGSRALQLTTQPPSHLCNISLEVALYSVVYPKTLFLVI